MKSHLEINFHNTILVITMLGFPDFKAVYSQTGSNGKGPDGRFKIIYTVLVCPIGDS